MMDKYKKAAVLAAGLLKNGHCSDRAAAWKRATKEIFPSSQSLQEKGCPRGAFFGLCNGGLVVDLAPGDYSKLSKNGEYAVLAIEILRKNKFLASQPDMLWKKVAGNTKTHNHQMDVVIGLWEAGLIKA